MKCRQQQFLQFIVVFSETRFFCSTLFCFNMSRSTPYHHTHDKLYGVRACTESGEVKYAECLFCRCFGREQKSGSKRKPLTSIHYYQIPFRRDSYLRHLKTQHDTQYKEFCKIPLEKRNSYFKKDTGTIYSYFKSEATKVFEVETEIINGLIADLFLEMNEELDEDFSVVEKALKIFKFDDDLGLYLFTVPNMTQFNLVCSMVARGASFRMVADFIAIFKNITGSHQVGNVNQARVISYVRSVCATNLQKLKNLLGCAWTFSVALDMSTHMSTSYLDIRIRVYAKGKIRNFHVLAVPMYGSHTAAAIYKTACKVFNVLCPSWQRNIISLTTDGERKMTGKVKGVATLFEKAAEEGFFRLWCGLHQLDLCLQRFFKSLLDEKFYVTITGLIGYLRRQVNLRTEMDTTCPIVSSTRWESMSRVSFTICQRYFFSKKLTLLFCLFLS